MAIQSAYRRGSGNQINIHMAEIDKLQNQQLMLNLATNTNKARNWIKDKVRDLTNPRPIALKDVTKRNELLRDHGRRETTFKLGSMYFFSYSPKLRGELSFYDLFPLVIPIESYSDGFLGLNLHYLSPGARAGLLGSLSKFATNKKFDEKTRIAASYQILKKAGISFQPCLKKYLLQQIRSRFLYISPEEWNIAIYLPVESFIGSSKREVFSGKAGKK